MREIKFRAWHREKNVMLTVTTISWMKNADGSPLCGCDGYNKTIPHTNFGLHDVEVMQYTGLKDKNGKEIYEGDILCVLEDVVADTIDGFNRYEKEGDFMKVVFDKYGRWSVKGNSMVDGELLHDMLSDAEIIGNVHESPDLINQT
jgi:uncharacterized phage protein (TIGR01671 family)